MNTVSPSLHQSSLPLLTGHTAESKCFGDEGVREDEGVSQGGVCAIYVRRPQSLGAVLISYCPGSITAGMFITNKIFTHRHGGQKSPLTPKHENFAVIIV